MLPAFAAPAHVAGPVDAAARLAPGLLLALVHGLLHRHGGLNATDAVEAMSQRLDTVARTRTHGDDLPAADTSALSREAGRLDLGRRVAGRAPFGIYFQNHHVW